MSRPVIKEVDIREVLTWYFSLFPTDDPYGEETIINHCVDHYRPKPSDKSK